MKKESLESELAEQLRQLRKRHGLSVSKMADLTWTDERTWAKYERGESAPSAPELVRIFDAFGEDLLRSMLECVYSDVYKDIEQRPTQDMRQAAIHFFQHVATDDMCRDFCYIAFGNHGSNVRPQLKELVVLDHVPLDYRVAITKNIVTFYNLAEARGELICDGEAPVDIHALVEAIRKGLEAVKEGRNSYTTATED